MAKSSKAKTKYEYRKLAQRLSDIGFNMNLAPVVDVDKNSNNPIIGGLGRSFSSDPITVASYAAFFIQEHRKLGVLTSLKHFPGHGSSQQDTHTAIADVADTWRPDELIPFHILIQDRLVDSIMVSHLSNAKVWGGAASQAPSTAISELLRGKLKFDGVIISDDLGMDAVRLSKTPFSEVITSAVRAGVDLVIVGRLPDQEQAFDAGRYANSALVNAIDSGEIDSQSIKRSLDRIAKLKKQIRCCRK
jgi:beta-N-acetylhexosaminidase